MSNEVNFQKALKKTKVYLHFEDGKSFSGYTNLAPNSAKLKNGIWGEAAFTTGMAGYQETMTDPSFLGQHIIFTNSHIGNYESCPEVMQSKKFHGTSLIARNFSYNQFSNDLLVKETPFFTYLDTRSLTKYLSSTTKHKSVITLNSSAPKKEEFINAKLDCSNLAMVSIPEPKVIREGDSPIVIIDYGIKNSIVNNIKDFDLPVVQLPYNSTSSDIKKYNPRLIFLSNGPGDPRVYDQEIQVVKELLALNIPLRGICLGHQLLSLALGADIIKLPFGQRGVNHPVLDHVSGEILITSQNHGYSTDKESFLGLGANNPLGREMIIQHSSLFDKSIEGITSTDHFLKSVQFHPESNPGPSDAHIFFTEIEEYLKGNKDLDIDTSKLEPLKNIDGSLTKDIPYKKILLIGSGPIKIGQASEFDYSGTQALKSLKEIGLDVVLLNSNPATIMTDPEMAYKTYIEPITKETIKNIIKKEKVDSILSTMGGQTALNICVELEEENYLKENNVALLGANVDTIKKTEDRELFAIELKTLGYKTGSRFKAQSENEVRVMAASKVGYPLIVRRDFALGGKGAALIYKEEDLDQIFTTDLKYPVTMEKSLVGYKEIELEVMVDREKNGVIICSIENVDPCGIHTGDSITVAPAQTISDRCYQELRTISLTVAKHMGVVAGGANVQFAINPYDETDIVVIEMNPRVSRSSALASKATGYPIAKISALLSVGFTLKEILNDITKASPVAFEPSLDYVALKIPIFPFDKFPTSSKELGPQMRSVGEVLALAGSFNESFFKALRSLEMGLEIPELDQLKTSPAIIDEEYLRTRLKTRSELSLLTVLECLRKGMSEKEVHSISMISPWFISQMQLFVDAERSIKNDFDIKNTSNQTQTYDDLKSFKAQGFSDKHIAKLTNCGQREILELRNKLKLFPIFKAVDTCSGEFHASTPYFYSTYSEENEAISLSDEYKSIAIFGSGPNRIGQGIEFDYSCVKACMHLEKKNIKAIMINSNPETVSTDYDSSDRLYLSALYSEDLFDILLNERPSGVITSFSGQTGINIRTHLENDYRKEIYNINFLGPDLRTLDLTEDRKLFSEITKKVDLAHTEAIQVSGYKHLLNAIIEIGFPVIIRPSYVIGGESMFIFRSHEDIEQLPPAHRELLKNSATIFQVETYLEDAYEYDVDLIRDQFGNCVFTVCEHIEYAGVHSGDSGMINPPVMLTSKLYKKMKKISVDLARELNIVGPINFQYAIKDELIYCIEANPRGSRTLPFLSKATNMSLPQIATDCMLGEKIENWDREQADFFCVKQSTFPFDRFIKDNIILGPKMRSTGETLGIDSDKDAAILKSYLGNYPDLMNKNKILLSLADKNKPIVVPYLKRLHQLGLKFYATGGTYDYIKKQNLPCVKVAKVNSKKDIDMPMLDILKDEDLAMVFNTPMNNGGSKSEGEFIRNSAIENGTPCFTRVENIKAVIESIIGCNGEELSPVGLQDIHTS